MKKLYLPLLFAAQLSAGFSQCELKTSSDNDQTLNIDHEGLDITITSDDAIKDLPRLKDKYRDEIRFNITLFVDGKRIYTAYDYYKKSDDAAIYNQTANGKKLNITVIPDKTSSDDSMNDDLEYMGKLLGEFSPGKHELEIKFGPSGQYRKSYLCTKKMEIEISGETQAKINERLAQIKSNADNDQAGNLTLPESKMTHAGVSKEIGQFYSDEYGSDARIIISDKDWSVYKNDAGEIQYKYVHIAATWKKDDKDYVDYNIVSQRFNGKQYSGSYDLQKPVNPKLIKL